MAKREPDPRMMHPIGVVARRTGLSPDVLRVWEKRYGVVRPVRVGRRRMYSDEDVERLTLLRKVTQAGHSIGQVSGLAPEALEELVRQEEAVSARAPAWPLHRAEGPEGDPVPHLEACLRAVRDMDAGGLEVALSRATLVLSQWAVIDQVIVPLMHEIGRQWREGALRVAHEHLASAVVRSFLGLITRARDPGGAPTLVVGTPAGQQHELGALVVVAAAMTEGWRVTYLGPNLPAEDLASAAGARGARALALSLTYPADDPRLPEELARLRGLLPRGVALLVGGAATEAYGQVLAEVGATCLRDMPELREALESLRREGPARG